MGCCLPGGDRFDNGALCDMSTCCEPLLPRHERALRLKINELFEVINKDRNPCCCASLCCCFCPEQLTTTEAELFMERVLNLTEDKDIWDNLGIFETDEHKAEYEMILLNVAKAVRKGFIEEDDGEFKIKNLTKAEFRYIVAQYFMSV